MKIQFVGANRQVTGSCYFLETGGLRLLIDCGLYQNRLASLAQLLQSTPSSTFFDP